MERTDAEYRALLTKNGVPFDLEGTVVEARFQARYADWYVRIDAGDAYGRWYWWDGKQWKPTMYGPE